MVRATSLNKREREAVETLRFCFGIQNWEHFQRCTGYKSSPVVLVTHLVKKTKKTQRALELIEIYQRFYGGNNE